MSNSKKILDFEIIDFKTVFKSNKTVNLNDEKKSHLNNIIYDNTQNGLLIVYSEENSSKQNVSLIKLLNESVLAFFKKRYHLNPQEAINEAFSYVSKKLFYSSFQNVRLVGRKLNSLIVLIRNKRIYFGSIGTNNLFLKTNNAFKRLTPKQYSLEDDQFTETIALKTSDLNQDLKINFENSPIYPHKGDLLIITSAEYTLISDEVIANLFADDENIEKSAIKLLKQFSEREDINNPNFVITKLNFKGGGYSYNRNFRFFYENFFQKILNVITSVPILIFMAVVVLVLLYFLLKN